MNTLGRQRCLYHADREAVARCPECARFFCRECVSEHDDRVLCAACLAKLAAPAARPSSSALEGVLLLGQSVVAVAVIWFFFFLIGRSLAAVPSAFHEGRLWEFSTSE